MINGIPSFNVLCFRIQIRSSERKTLQMIAINRGRMKNILTPLFVSFGEDFGTFVNSPWYWCPLLQEAVLFFTRRHGVWICTLVLRYLITVLWKHSSGIQRVDAILKNWKCVSYFYQCKNWDTFFPDDRGPFQVGSLLSARSSHGLCAQKHGVK